MKKVEVFNFWECSCIGLNISEGDELTCKIDLSLSEAKQVLSELGNAIKGYEQLESLVSKPPKPSDVIYVDEPNLLVYGVNMAGWYFHMEEHLHGPFHTKSACMRELHDYKTLRKINYLF